MKFRRTTVYVAVAGLVLVASTLGGSGIVAHAGEHTETPGDEGEAADAERLLQQLDHLLESVVDLLKTVGEIAKATGGEG